MFETSGVLVEFLGSRKITPFRNCTEGFGVNTNNPRKHREDVGWAAKEEEGAG